MSWFDESPQWRWSWEAMCGPRGLKIWSSNLHDLGICFQYLCLQIPVLVILALTSAYYSGRNFGYVVRGRLQTRAIKTRAGLAILLAIIPVVQTYIQFIKKSDELTPIIRVFVATTQCITWIVHFIYLLALKNRLGLSQRGPVKICVLLTLYAVLSVIALHSNYLINYYEPNYINELMFRTSVTNVVALVFYIILLIPSEGSTVLLNYNSRYVQVIISVRLSLRIF